MVEQEPNQPKYSLNSVGAKVDEISGILKTLVPDVNELMQDKRDKIVADKAVAQWVQQNPQQQLSTPSTPPQDSELTQQLLKYLGIALGIISAMVILYGQLKGVTK